MQVIAFAVLGVPAPQGSKRHVGKGVMVESSQKVKPWREAVKSAAYETRSDRSESPLSGPMNVSLHFYLARPKGHYRTGKKAGEVKQSAPAYPETRPDLDKLVRSTLDAITESGLIRDDSQIVQLVAWKDYCDDVQATPGAFIVVDKAI